jgi:hypothetical protein
MAYNISDNIMNPCGTKQAGSPRKEKPNPCLPHVTHAIVPCLVAVYLTLCSQEEIALVENCLIMEFVVGWGAENGVRQILLHLRGHFRYLPLKMPMHHWSTLEFGPAVILIYPGFKECSVFPYQ